MFLKDAVRRSFTDFVCGSSCLTTVVCGSSYFVNWHMTRPIIQTYFRTVVMSLNRGSDWSRFKSPLVALNETTKYWSCFKTQRSRNATTLIGSVL